MRVVKCEQGQALIISSPVRAGAEPFVSFTGGVIWPMQKAELLDITVKPLEVKVPGVSKDNRPVLVVATFYVKVRREPSSVLEVARNVGCDAASDPESVRALFAGKFGEATKTAVKLFELSELERRAQEFRDTIIEMIGMDLSGYHLEDVSIDSVTPRDFQMVALGSERFILDWIEVKQSGRLDKLTEQHGFSVVARRGADGTVEHAPPGETRLSPGDSLAVAVAADKYEDLKRALMA